VISRNKILAKPSTLCNRNESILVYDCLARVIAPFRLQTGGIVMHHPWTNCQVPAYREDEQATAKFLPFGFPYIMKLKLKGPTFVINLSSILEWQTYIDQSSSDKPPVITKFAVGNV
jgi:hypothetical protein